MSRMKKIWLLSIMLYVFIPLYSAGETETKQSPSHWQRYGWNTVEIVAGALTASLICDGFLFVTKQNVMKKTERIKKASGFFIMLGGFLFYKKSVVHSCYNSAQQGISTIIDTSNNKINKWYVPTQNNPNQNAPAYTLTPIPNLLYKYVI